MSFFEMSTKKVRDLTEEYAHKVKLWKEEKQMPKNEWGALKDLPKDILKHMQTIGAERADSNLDDSDYERLGKEWNLVNKMKGIIERIIHELGKMEKTGQIKIV